MLINLLSSSLLEQFLNKLNPDFHTPHHHFCICISYFFFTVDGSKVEADSNFFILNFFTTQMDPCHQVQVTNQLKAAWNFVFDSRRFERKLCAAKLWRPLINCPGTIRRTHYPTAILWDLRMTKWITWSKDKIPWPTLSRTTRKRIFLETENVFQNCTMEIFSKSNNFAQLFLRVDMRPKKSWSTIKKELKSSCNYFFKCLK